MIEGNLADIKQFCRFNIYKTPLPRGVYRLAGNAVLISNISSLTVHCINNNSHYRIDHVQEVYQLHCACHFVEDEFFIPRSSIHCPEFDNITVDFTPQYLLYLAYISEFVQ